MNGSDWQTPTAAGLVLLTALAFVVRAAARRGRAGGCGAGCGCAAKPKPGRKGDGAPPQS